MHRALRNRYIRQKFVIFNTANSHPWFESIQTLPIPIWSIRIPWIDNWMQYDKNVDKMVLCLLEKSDVYIATEKRRRQSKACFVNNTISYRKFPKTKIQKTHTVYALRRNDSTERIDSLPRKSSCTYIPLRRSLEISPRFPIFFAWNFSFYREEPNAHSTWRTTVWTRYENDNGDKTIDITRTLKNLLRIQAYLSFTIWTWLWV